MKKTDIILQDHWKHLKNFTDARISLGRCGVSLPTHERLKLQLAHAKARDAVYLHVDTQKIIDLISEHALQNIIIKSQAQSRDEYLTRPDKGRLLSEESASLLKGQNEADISIVIADGLSSHAIHDNIPPLLKLLIPAIKQSGLRLAPLCFAQNARVALADDVAPFFKAKITLILIGERPGLSSPNSLGAYLTYSAQRGTTDESRNCVSNIRENGLSYTVATQKICYLIEEALHGQYSGVQLKDKMPTNYLPFKGANTQLKE